jgi:hypothetical protein
MIILPLLTELSKNRKFKTTRTGHVYIPKEVKAAKQIIGILIKKGVINYKLEKNKKTWIKMLVKKSNPRFDAINLIDNLADILQEVTGINDNLYSILLDWELVTVKNICIELEIYQ